MDELELQFSPELFKQRMELDMLRGEGAAFTMESSQPSSEIPLEPLLSVDDDEQFVRELYWTVLGRSAEPQGLQHTLGLLQSGATRRFIINAFASSPEASVQNVRFTPLPEETAPPAFDAEQADRKESIVVLGAGGHARVVLEILESMDKFEIAGCIGDASSEPTILGYRFLGSDDVLPDLFGSVRHAFVAIGDNASRKAAATAAMKLGYRLINAVSPRAIVSPRATLGVGVAIMPGAVINTQAVIQDGSIINTGATVDHDCSVGSYSHIGPGSNLAGCIRVGEGAFLGVGCKVIPKITIGRWSIIGAGSVVIRDVADNATVAGVPARAIR